MRLHITHTTRYDYTPAVEHAQHIAHLKPRDTPAQRLLSHSLQIDPPPAGLAEMHDVHGNHRVFFSLRSTHEALSVTARSEVQTLPPGERAPAPEAPEVPDLPWEQVRERFRYRAAAPYERAAEFVFASPYVPRQEEFADYARPSFTAGRPLLDAAHDLMQRIHAEFTYETASTQVNTPPLQALQQRKGVCQDFAHVMVACLRALGLPARYVSGYLLTEPPAGQPRLIGADASHAWASVYLPAVQPGEGRWHDFCPTNARAGADSPGADYVTVAVGRDYSDVSPLRGVIHGGARHKLHVAVTVQPADELATRPPEPSAANTSKDPS